MNQLAKDCQRIGEIPHLQSQQVSHDHAKFYQRLSLGSFMSPFPFFQPYIHKIFYITGADSNTKKITKSTRVIDR